MPSESSQTASGSVRTADAPPALNGKLQYRKRNYGIAIDAVGRRNRYEFQRELPLRHPQHRHRTIGELVGFLASPVEPDPTHPA